jgi:hypothetical protein
MHHDLVPITLSELPKANSRRKVCTSTCWLQCLAINSAVYRRVFQVPPQMWIDEHEPHFGRETLEPNSQKTRASGSSRHRLTLPSRSNRTTGKRLAGFPDLRLNDPDRLPRAFSSGGLLVGSPRSQLRGSGGF